MEETKLIFIEKGAMDKYTQRKLEARGIFIVPVSDLSKVKMSNDVGFLNNQILFDAAMETLNSSETSSSIVQRFGKGVVQKVLAKKQTE